MSTRKVFVAPSVLTADFSKMGEEIRKVESFGGDWIHLDVMDGHFVPNISFGPKMVADLRKCSQLPFDVHLMTEKPDNFIAGFAEAGADYITFHIEESVHANRTVDHIQKLGKKAGVSVVPSTPAFMLKELLPFVDLVLVMTVNPGYGGQKMISECLEKIRFLDEARMKENYSFLIAADGGINRFTASEVRASGTDVLIIGSAFFDAKDPASEVSILKGNLIV